MSSLQRLFLDTNIFILGDADRTSSESFILEALGYRNHSPILQVELILSDELLDQIRRVGKYLYGKDQAGQLLSNIWRWFDIFYVSSTVDWSEEKSRLINRKIIPLEDLEIFLSAKYGQANCFVSGNRELLKAIAEFECLTPDDFIQKYLSPYSKTNQ